MNIPRPQEYHVNIRAVSWVSKFHWEETRVEAIYEIW